MSSPRRKSTLTNYVISDEEIKKIMNTDNPFNNTLSKLSASSGSPKPAPIHIDTRAPVIHTGQRKLPRGAEERALKHKKHKKTSKGKEPADTVKVQPAAVESSTSSKPVPEFLKNTLYTPFNELNEDEQRSFIARLLTTKPEDLTEPERRHVDMIEKMKNLSRIRESMSGKVIVETDDPNVSMAGFRLDESMAEQMVALGIQMTDEQKYVFDAYMNTMKEHFNNLIGSIRPDHLQSDPSANVVDDHMHAKRLWASLLSGHRHSEKLDSYDKQTLLQTYGDKWEERLNKILHPPVDDDY